jgi:hypothetical protein
MRVRSLFLLLAQRELERLYWVFTFLCHVVCDRIWQSNKKISWPAEYLKQSSTANN